MPRVVLTPNHDLVDFIDERDEVGEGGGAATLTLSQAELTALDAPDDGTAFTTLNRSIFGDGGGGNWYWNAASTATPDDAMVLQRDAGGTGRFLRDWDGFNVKAAWFGQVGDGVTAAASAISAAIDACPESGTVWLGSGEVLMDTFVLKTGKSNFTIAAESDGRTTLVASAAAIDTAGFSGYFQFRGTDTNNRISNITVRGIRFDTSIWTDGTNRATTGTLPDQSGLATGEIKLASTASNTAGYYNSAVIQFNTGAAAGTLRILTSHNTGTDISPSTDFDTGLAAWANGQPSAGDTYSILTGGGTFAQTSYGVGGAVAQWADGIQFIDCKWIGGWNGPHFRGCSDFKVFNCDCENVGEGFIDIRDECDGGQIIGGIWNSGEGVDCVGGSHIIKGVHWTSISDKDQFCDFNEVSDVTVEGCVTYGGDQAFDFHGNAASARITIKGCICENFRTAGVYIIGDTEDYERIIVSDSIFTSTRTDSAAGYAYGVFVGGTSTGYTDMRQVTIGHCDIETTGNAIRINRTKNLKVVGCNLRSSMKAPVTCAPASAHPITDVVIENNDIWGEWVNGETNHDNLSIGAITFNNYASNITLRNNRVHASGGMGIKCNDVSNVIIEGNELFADSADTNGGAVFCQTVSSLTVRNNVIYGATTYGYYMLNNANMTLVGNKSYLTGRNAMHIRLTSATPIVSNRLNWQINNNYLQNWGGPNNAGSPTTSNQYAIRLDFSSAVALSADLRGIQINGNMFASPAYTTLSSVLGIGFTQATTGGFSIYVEMVDNNGSDAINEFPVVTGAWLFSTDIEPNVGNKTLPAQESGSSYSNAGATFAITFTLPPALPGLTYSFYVMDTDGVRVDPSSTETTNKTIGGSQEAAGKYITSSTVGDYIRLRCTKAGEWQALEVVGTWTAEA
jgi:hypothetical protein